LLTMVSRADVLWTKVMSASMIVRWMGRPRRCVTMGGTNGKQTCLKAEKSEWLGRADATLRIMIRRPRIRVLSLDTLRFLAPCPSLAVARVFVPFLYRSQV
jgi:hypothetical protein